MEISKEKILECNKKLMFSRMRVLINHGFYGLLLMHMVFALDENCKTVTTDGRKIYFNPKFLLDLSNKELDFVMMHQILHVVLRHRARKGDRDEVIYDIACDIVVDSNIYYSSGQDEQSITTRQFGTAIHTMPNGDEGYRYTAEDIYEVLCFQSA